MNSDRFSWSSLMDWAIDQLLFLFTNYPRAARTQFPLIEATDGQEPTAESRREEARKIDAMPVSYPPRKLATVSSKALDKEFWDSF